MLNIEPISKLQKLSKAGKIGARRCYDLHGNPGTKEGRKKGGANSCTKQQKNARDGKKFGFVIRKKFSLPEHSNQLAEIIGVILGDGCISKFQVSTYSNAKVDKEYAIHISTLLEKLFEVNVARSKLRNNTITQVISSRGIVEFFNKMGLKTGNKIKNNISIPEWILKKHEYSRACLRGLFDTDGCIYYHRHSIKGREYNDIGWEFRNYNQNLLREFHVFLLQNGYKSKLNEGRVSLYNRDDIHRYFKYVGSNNPKHIKKYSEYFSSIKLGRGTKVV